MIEVNAGTLLMTIAMILIAVFGAIQVGIHRELDYLHGKKNTVYRFRIPLITRKKTRGLHQRGASR